jgi:hypothetical protein
VSNLSQWSALVGFILPLVVAIVQQSHFSRTARTIIGAVSVVVSAVITALLQNTLDWNTWATSVIWIATTAFTAYRNVWVPLGAADWIEAVTSGKSVTHAKSVRKARTGESA